MFLQKHPERLSKLLPQNSPPDSFTASCNITQQPTIPKGEFWRPIRTKNNHFWKEIHLPKHNCLISMLDFQGAPIPETNSGFFQFFQQKKHIFQMSSPKTVMTSTHATHLSRGTAVSAESQERNQVGTLEINDIAMPQRLASQKGWPDRKTWKFQPNDRVTNIHGPWCCNFPLFVRVKPMSGRTEKENCIQMLPIEKNTGFWISWPSDLVAEW